MHCEKMLKSKHARQAFVCLNSSWLPGIKKKFPSSVTTAMSIAWRSSRHDMERPSGGTLTHQQHPPLLSLPQPATCKTLPESLSMSPIKRLHTTDHCCDTWREPFVRPPVRFPMTSFCFLKLGRNRSKNDYMKLSLKRAFEGSKKSEDIGITVSSEDQFLPFSFKNFKCN